jgi:predicted RNA binding protein YcfA (HicA-like mRNA interferase family)
MNSKKVIKLIEADGWKLVATKGSHHQYKHHTKKGRITIPHPKKDLTIGTLKSIEKQSGVSLK